MSSQNKIKIALILDSRLSRERRHIFDRLVYALQGHAEVHDLPVKDDESWVLNHLQQNLYHLVLAPWDLYLRWNRVEAFYGLTRTSGPTFAGYIADPAQCVEIHAPAGYQRVMILDYSQLSRDIAVKLTLAIAEDRQRWGLLPVIEKKSVIFSKILEKTEDTDLFDLIQSKVPFLSDGPWKKRSLQIQSALIALRELLFKELSRQKILLQFHGHQESLIVRICADIPSWTSPSHALSTFLVPDAEFSEWRPGKMLRRCSDWMRIHFVAETKQLEITLGYLESAPSLEQKDGTHTIWIEPVSPPLAQEQDEPSHETQWIENSPARHTPETPVWDEKLVSENTQLREKIKKIETQIQELVSGGVGQITQSLAPPDSESLWEAFQERYLDLTYQIQHAEKEIQGAPIERRIHLKVKLDSLRKKEAHFAKSFADFLIKIKEYRRSA